MYIGTFFHCDLVFFRDFLSAAFFPDFISATFFSNTCVSTLTDFYALPPPSSTMCVLLKILCLGVCVKSDDSPHPRVVGFCISIQIL